jgi:hypothetical protein
MRKLKYICICGAMFALFVGATGSAVLAQDVSKKPFTKKPMSSGEKSLSKDASHLAPGRCWTTVYVQWYPGSAGTFAGKCKKTVKKVADCKGPVVR